jgi:predicted nucleotidyltransferase
MLIAENLRFSQNPLEIVDKMSTIVDDMSTKGLAASLLPLTRRLVLRELTLSKENPIHIRRIARQTGLDPSGVQREIKNLLESGIIVEERSGNQKLYSLNESCPIYQELRTIIIKTVGVADRLRDALTPLRGKIHEAFIYGSFASGTENADSDVDLMVIGDSSLKEIVSAVSSVGHEINRVINSTVISKAEFEKRLKEKDGFMTRVYKGSKIIILGKSNDA